MTEREQDEATAALKALEHPMRRDIVKAVHHHNLATTSPIEVSQLLGLPLYSVAYHCRQLAEYKALELIETVPVRGAIKHIYRLSQGFIERPGVLEFLGQPSTKANQNF